LRKASPAKAEAKSEAAAEKKKQCSTKVGNEEFPCCDVPEYKDIPEGEHTPQWLLAGATKLTYATLCPLVRPHVLKEATPPTHSWRPMRWIFEHGVYRPMAFLYFVSGLALLFIALLLRPNANSLHGLYRDRLSKAFLFDPRDTGPQDVERGEASLDQGRDFPQLDDKALSWLSPRDAPYQLINAALNIQGSDYANRRGRNADFFMFSQRYVGSDATGYAPTPEFEKAAPDLSLATAMAISGAAVSSNMGSESVKPLRVSLALLNVRLGYWLKNPRYTAVERASRWHPGSWTSLYMLAEISGRLYENSNDVYLTDGGHIENLGVYQLLKRRCKLIIVVDAEADLSVRFPSFITLQRYARIDLGIRIEMPWDDIRKTTCAWMNSHTDAESNPVSSSGPHAAIGSIDYGQGRLGTILYLKASLTGEENDYIRDYARRFVSFPHETTSDQFFSEEQFEVYRALGFHITHGVLSGRDDICAPTETSAEKCKFDSTGNKTVQTVHAALTA
jgi:hypothetical protein